MNCTKAFFFALFDMEDNSNLRQLIIFILLTDSRLRSLANHIRHIPDTHLRINTLAMGTLPLKMFFYSYKMSLYS